MSALCTVCNHYPCPGCLGARMDEIKRLQVEIRDLRTELAAERTRAVLLVSKLDAARDRFDDIEATLEEWRRRDDAPRAGDAVSPVSTEKPK